MGVSVVSLQVCGNVTNTSNIENIHSSEEILKKSHN
jgi:hypothetical protein